MRFNEVVRFELSDNNEYNGIANLPQQLRNSLEESLMTNNPHLFFNVIKQVEKQTISIEARLRIILQRYLLLGGYPEIVLNKIEHDQAFRRMRDYADLVLQKDFVRFFGIRDSKSMERIIRLIAKNTSNILVERNLAKNLSIATNTVRNYLMFLEDTFLIMSAKLFTVSFARQMRQPEKYYIVDPGLGNALVGYGDEDRGFLAETIVCTHLQSFSYEKGWISNIYYWREKEKFEVDIIWEAKGKILPIEVKYRRAKKITGLKEFIGRSKTWGIVVSEELKIENNVLFIPPHLLLLL